MRFQTDRKYDEHLTDWNASGTTGILHAVKNYAPSVKRVVITSSFASVSFPHACL